MIVVVNVLSVSLNKMFPSFLLLFKLLGICIQRASVFSPKILILLLKKYEAINLFLFSNTNISCNKNMFIMTLYQ